MTWQADDPIGDFLDAMEARNAERGADACAGIAWGREHGGTIRETFLSLLAWERPPTLWMCNVLQNLGAEMSDDLVDIAVEIMAAHPTISTWQSYMVLRDQLSERHRLRMLRAMTTVGRVHPWLAKRAAEELADGDDVSD